jgi:hypothetical protein
MGGEDCSDCSTCIRSELYVYLVSIRDCLCAMIPRLMGIWLQRACPGESHYGRRQVRKTLACSCGVYPRSQPHGALRNTWFNQTDVDDLISVGINTVRIPVGRLHIPVFLPDHHTARLLDCRSPRRPRYRILPSRWTLTAREYKLTIPEKKC